jgi:biopolymer transport protein TolQ
MSVLVVLLLLSVASWSIILYKLWVFRRSERQSISFLDVFRRSSKFSEVQAVCRSLAESPLVGLFQAGYAELTAQLRQSTAPDTMETVASPRPGAARPTLKSLTAVDRALTRASVIEVNKLEKRLPFLATTASVAPFIGLFGTVVGIMMAFQGIGQTGSTNLSVVAPGIADALVATAAGLVAAIPAVVAYNHLSNRVRLFAAEMDDFAMEFLNIAERNFT